MKRILLSRASKSVCISVVFIFMSIFQGCMYYYKVQTVTRVSPENINTGDSLNKFLILHQGNSAWRISNPDIAQNMLSGNLSVLPNNCQQYKTNHPNGSNRYKRDDRILVLDQVHLYLQDSLVPEFKTGDHVKIDFSAFSKAERYIKAKGRTAASWVVPAVVVGLGIALVTTTTIAVLTKSSCPLVYIKKDSSFNFTGEIFGGAIYSSLERHDYLPLPGFSPSKNRYELKITNGLPEIQYINLSELWIVNHPENVKALPDRQGLIHTIEMPKVPTEAVSLANFDILPLIQTKDQLCFQFDEDASLTGDTCAFNTVFFTFPVQENADIGKLVICAGNSMWGDYTFGELTKLFGNRYEEFIRWQGKRPPDKTIQWRMDQRFPLMVYLETASGWQFVDYFDLIGPLGVRDMIMPIDLSMALFTKTSGNGRSIRIKLESGFKFWDLDYAAMDFSMDTLFMVDYIQPTSAFTESGRDVTQPLSKDDAKYYVQEKTGEEGLVVYKDSPEVRGMKKSIFLHTKGYYTHVRNYPNPPDKMKLETFFIPGRFSKFSYENYISFRKNKMVFVSDPRVP
jgi:hypothetical protein